MRGVCNFKAYTAFILLADIHFVRLYTPTDENQYISYFNYKFNLASLLSC